MRCYRGDHCDHNLYGYDSRQLAIALFWLCKIYESEGRLDIVTYWRKVTAFSHCLILVLLRHRLKPSRFRSQIFATLGTEGWTFYAGDSAQGIFLESLRMMMSLISRDSILVNGVRPLVHQARQLNHIVLLDFFHHRHLPVNNTSQHIIKTDAKHYSS